MKFNCSECLNPILATPEFFGLATTCPHCSSVIVVPIPTNQSLQGFEQFSGRRTPPPPPEDYRPAPAATWAPTPVPPSREPVPPAPQPVPPVPVPVPPAPEPAPHVPCPVPPAFETVSDFQEESSSASTYEPSTPPVTETEQEISPSRLIDDEEPVTQDSDVREESEVVPEPVETKSRLSKRTGERSSKKLSTGFGVSPRVRDRLKTTVQEEESPDLNRNGGFRSPQRIPRWLLIVVPIGLLVLGVIIVLLFFVFRSEIP